jgi:hypothetical protein
MCALVFVDEQLLLWADCVDSSAADVDDTPSVIVNGCLCDDARCRLHHSYRAARLIRAAEGSGHELGIAVMRQSAE